MASSTTKTPPARAASSQRGRGNVRRTSRQRRHRMPGGPLPERPPPRSPWQTWRDPAEARAEAPSTAVNGRSSAGKSEVACFTKDSMARAIGAHRRGASSAAPPGRNGRTDRSAERAVEESLGSVVSPTAVGTRKSTPLPSEKTTGTRSAKTTKATTTKSKGR